MSELPLLTRTEGVQQCRMIARLMLVKMNLLEG